MTEKLSSNHQTALSPASADNLSSEDSPSANSQPTPSTEHVTSPKPLATVKRRLAKVSLIPSANKTTTSNPSYVPVLQTAEQAGRPADRFRVNPADYPIFEKQYELDSHWGNNTRHYWNIDKTLSHFVTNTANLIAALDGSAAAYEANPNLPRPDHIIYLDKSARPVSWLVNTFWQDFSDQKRPEHSYLNIDRQPWFRRVGIAIDPNGYSKNPDGSDHRNGPSDFDINQVSPEDFARIRALYLENGLEDDSNTPENLAHIMSTPSKLDGKNIMIVDEVARTGATMKIAQDLIKAAFPEAASVQGAYFWSSGYKTNRDPNNPETQMLSVPVWYDSSSALGRGAGDVDQDFYNKRHEHFHTNRTRAQKFGALVLSSIPDLNQEKDNRSRELMREITKMHEDFQAGKIILRTPQNYSNERALQTIQKQGLRLAPSTDTSPDTFINIIKAIDQRPPTY